jgi:hypothetical protein
VGNELGLLLEKLGSHWEMHWRCAGRELRPAWASTGEVLSCTGLALGTALEKTGRTTGRRTRQHWESLGPALKTLGAALNSTGDALGPPLGWHQPGARRTGSTTGDELTTVGNEPDCCSEKR